MGHVDEAIGLASDMDKAWTNPLYIGMRPQFCGYPEDYQKTEEGKALLMRMRQKFLAEELPKFMQFYADFMGENVFFCGSKITIADCIIYPQLMKYKAGYIDHVPADCLDKFPKITAYLARVGNVPAIKAWYSSR